MKVKSPSETAGPLTGKQYEWVGHFRNHLNEGHNDGPKFRNVRKGSSSTAGMSQEEMNAGADMEEQSRRTSFPISEKLLLHKEYAQDEERQLEREYRKEKK